MARLQTSGNINKVFTVTFDYKNQEIEISVNDKGSHLEVRADGVIIHDFFGQAYDWQSTYGLHGAAESQAIVGQLRKHAIYLIENQMDCDE